MGRMFLKSLFFLFPRWLSQSPIQLSTVDRFHLQALNVTNLDLIPDRPLVAERPRGGPLTSLGLVLNLIQIIAILSFFHKWG